LDFLVQSKSGEYLGIQIRDYDFIHKGAEAESKDMATDIYILQELQKEGINLKGGKIITISDNDITTVDDAKRTLETLI
jgi:hypothetical protein